MSHGGNYDYGPAGGIDWEPIGVIFWVLCGMAMVPLVPTTFIAGPYFPLRLVVTIFVVTAWVAGCVVMDRQDRF